VLAWTTHGYPFFVHGEPEASEGLAALVGEKMSIPVHIPKYMEKVKI